MSRKVNLLNCAYGAAAAAGSAGTFAFVSLFNNDNLGRYFAVWDVARSSIITTQTGLLIQNKQIGSNPITPLPLVTNQPSPNGQITTGNAAALPTFNAIHAQLEVGNLWPKQFPIVVLAAGWSITYYNPTNNTAITVGFVFEAIDASDLMGIEPPRELKLPTTITLNLEAK